MTTHFSRMAAVAAALLWGAAAGAATGDGVLLTNFASATYQNTAGNAYEIAYAVTETVLVATPATLIRKDANPTMQAAGGTVTFCITFSNTSAFASAVNVTVSDKVPDNMRWVGWGTLWNPGGGAPTTAYAAAPPAWTDGTPPAAGQYYLRWTMNVVGPRRSGIVCFLATVL